MFYQNRLKIGQEHCGFVKDTGTRNAIFMFRIISERTIQIQTEVCLRFVDYLKVFDKVHYNELLEMLGNLDM